MAAFGIDIVSRGFDPLEVLLSDKIIAKAETVATIFADTYRLVLPYFQRGYAWQEAHAARLRGAALSAAND